MYNFDSRELKTIAVMTSGGDAPGMNAAIRSVVRTACDKGLAVKGVLQGFAGLCSGQFIDLLPRSCANIIQRGGTVLRTSRYPEFKSKNIQEKAAQNLKNAQIDALVCIGGDGSIRGAVALWQNFAIPYVGIPASIDNDLYGTQSIGFDTATNIALEAIDRIRDTAASHDRLFIVEVMGRNTGFLAANVGLAGGAEDIFIPEIPISVENVVGKISSGIRKGKLSSIIVTAEAHKPGRAYDLAENIRKKSGMEAKVCILGHVQRGGSPSATDRVMASQFGHSAVDALLKGLCNVIICEQNGQFTALPSDQILDTPKSAPKTTLDLARILSN